MASSAYFLSAIFLLVHIVGDVEACIYKYGTSPDSLEPPKAGTPWDHGLSGDDWVGVDGSGRPWVCKTGLRQSPLNLPSANQIGNELGNGLRTRWFYPPLVSNGTNVEVINNGHTIQVEWLYNYEGRADIIVPDVIDNTTRITSVLSMTESANQNTISARPVQFHFHSTSEHLISGRYFPLELHIVHRVTGGIPACANGCFSVTGILFELCETCPDNPLIEPIWAVMPTREGTIRKLPAGAAIQLSALLGSAAPPYYTYEGSLTTPPCSEGLLWHVVTLTQKISLAQWTKYKTAVSFKDCELKSSGGSILSIGISLGRRALASSTSTNPNDWNCTLAAYGTNFRSAQPLNGRILRVSYGQ